MQIVRLVRRTKQRSLLRAESEPIMTASTEARVIGNHAAMGESTPAAINRPYLSVHEVLGAGVRRAAGRRDMAVAQAVWDSEGGANEARE